MLSRGIDADEIKNEALNRGSESPATSAFNSRDKFTRRDVRWENPRRKQRDWGKQCCSVGRVWGRGSKHDNSRRGTESNSWNEKGIGTWK